MIIFSRTIKWQVIPGSLRSILYRTKVLASVNLDHQVHLDLDGHGVTLSSQEAFALGRAIMHAALGEGVPAGPHSPFTCNGD
jgi:hypothetical protein